MYYVQLKTLNIMIKNGTKVIVLAFEDYPEEALFEWDLK